MHINHDYVALDWVKDEIEVTLKQAQQALEAFSENPQDTTRMRFCLTYLHQVHGTLQMVEFFGASILAEEMEMLAQAILNNETEDSESAQGTLLQATFQLPAYLDKVKQGRKDMPIIVLPLLNQLRSERGESLLSETSFFNPDLESGNEAFYKRSRPLEERRQAPTLRQLRQLFQVAYASVLRNRDSDNQLVKIAKVTKLVEQEAHDSPSAQLWWVASALTEGLRQQSIQLNDTSKALLSILDKHLKAAVDSDGASFQYDLDQQELKRFLLIIAQSHANSSLIQEVKSAYNLNDILLAGDMQNEGQHAHTDIDRAALQSATGALIEEINEIKDGLDIYIRSKDRDAGILGRLAKVIKHCSDTLVLLGMGSQRKILMSQVDTLNWCTEHPEKEATDNKLLDVAGALIYVESTLSAYQTGEITALSDGDPLTLSPQHVNQAQNALIRECQAGLETAKDHVVDFIVSQWDASHLENVPDIFEEVSGGLKIIHQDRAGVLVNYCAYYIKEHLLERSQADAPNWQIMDTLADAISSIECYLERLVNDSHTDDYILDIAESSLASMGYTNTSSPEDSDTTTVNETSSDSTPTDHDTSHPGIDSPESASSDDTLISLDGLTDLENIDFDEEDSTPATEVETKAEAEPAPEEAAFHETETAEQDDDMIDDEIIEIFVEESEEVLEAINSHLPAWKENWENQEPLTEIRRAFHTLKGSGRLVGAKEAGELAWSVENMLNRVLEDALPVSTDMIDLIEQVTAMIPAYVTAFEQRTNPPSGDTEIIEKANRISEGLAITTSIEEALVEEEATLELDTEPELSNEKPVLEMETELDNENVSDEVLLETPEAQDSVEIEQEDLAQNELSEPDSEESASEELETEESSLTSEEENNREFEAALLEIFVGEAQSHLSTVQEFIDQHPVHSAPVKVSTDVLRALHTLKGSAHMANAKAIAAIVSPVEQLVKQVANIDYMLSKDLLELLVTATRVLSEKVTHLQAGMTEEIVLGEPLLIAQINHLEEQYQQQKAEHGDRFQDENFINIFLAEEMDIILEAASHLNSWEQTPYNHDTAVQLEKEVLAIAEHAARANIPEIERLCTLLSQCYRAAQDHQIATDQVFFQTTHQAHNTLMELMDKLAAHQPIDESHEVEEKLASLLETSTLIIDESLQVESEDHQAEEAELEAGSTTEPGQPATDLSNNRDNDAATENTEAESTESYHAEAPELDDELVTIFLEEAEELLYELSQGLQAWTEAPSELPLIDPILRNLHTFKGSARMAGISPIGDLVHEAETLYENCRQGNLTFSAELLPLLNQSNDALADMIGSIQDNKPCQPASALIQSFKDFQNSSETLENTASQEQLPTEASHLEEAAEEETSHHVAEPAFDLDPDLDPELIEIFLEEAEEILDGLSGNLERWASDTSNTDEIQQLQRSLHTLKGGARMVGIKPIGNLSHELETLYELSTNGDIPYSEEMGELLIQCHDTLADMVDAVKANSPLHEASALIEQVLTFCGQPSQPFIATEEPGKEVEVATEDSAEITDTIIPISSTTPSQASETIDEELFIDTSDVEVITLFVEEANELLEGIESSIEQWEIAPNSTKQEAELKRLLHTLKGSSRLAGLSQLGDLSHRFEDFVTGLESHPEDNKEKLFELIKAHYDGLVSWVEKLATQLKGQLDEPAKDRSKEAAEQAAEITRKAQSANEKPLSKAEEQQEATKAATQEMIRVSSELLENLVNLAGETSINRAQVEKEITDFSHTLEEIGDTIERLQEQMRRLNMETEAQILFSHEAQVQEESDAYDDFDPLEMDRYSLIHQLSRSLSESTHDLTDLKDTLSNKARDTETLLLQQSRINTELQEGLMRTRLVPFSRLAPRLRRMVRQVSQEVGKSVELEIVNAEGEMDRAVLDRLVSPLEHMLRNSIDHGIEFPEEREKLEKNQKGKITLHLSREGAEVVIRLSDDGAGIDAAKVRQKAIERNLLDNHAELTDTEILQFIFKPGFSTAEKVTQLSGRGVGMDVVNSEIKQLSGTTRIHSSPGVGTQFTIRLPFTVSVNRALMVKVGEDTYAIPLSHIEGIVRVSPFELETYYQPDNEETFQYAERDYHLQYLGAYVKDIPSPILQGQSQPLPVILVRGTDKPMAFQVDSLIGSREVVVKSLGPQLSSVTGLSGATILGDGNVVIILDLISMIRSDWAERLYGESSKENATSTEKTSNETPTVMVVDDSVTVRKITSRLLERAGYEVILAKDGMDAISILQDRTPDVMLLDIEMPRMDGFEVASIIKHEERLKDIS